MSSSLLRQGHCISSTTVLSEMMQPAAGGCIQIRRRRRHRVSMVLKDSLDKGYVEWFDYVEWFGYAEWFGYVGWFGYAGWFGYVE